MASKDPAADGPSALAGSSASSSKEMPPNWLFKGAKWKETATSFAPISSAGACQRTRHTSQAVIGEDDTTPVAAKVARV